MVEVTAPSVTERVTVLVKEGLDVVAVVGCADGGGNALGGSDKRSPGTTVRVVDVRVVGAGAAPGAVPRAELAWSSCRRCHLGAGHPGRGGVLRGPASVPANSSAISVGIAVRMLDDALWIGFRLRVLCRTKR